ncbi:hypothetical protein F5148DRAFT_1357030, partial [Russula earlei]
SPWSRRPRPVLILCFPFTIPSLVLHHSHCPHITSFCHHPSVAHSCHRRHLSLVHLHHRSARPNGPSPSPSLSSRRLCFTHLRHHVYTHRHRPCILSPAHLGLSFTRRALSSTTGRRPCFAHDCHKRFLTPTLAHHHLCRMQFST